MKILSLFDGISCARVALERAGIPVEAYYASEVDKYAISISKYNYPDIKQIGSVVGLYPNCVLQHDIDLIIGGSPCQDLSIAKKDRKGLKGERSGLFYEYLRILKEVRPKYFVLENVNSMPKEAKQTITDELWGIEPVMINASLVSAQNRKRLFWVGIRTEGGYKKVEIPQPEDRGILLSDILQPLEEIDAKFFVEYDGDIDVSGMVERLKSNTIRTSGRGSGVDDRHNWDTIRVGQFNKGGQGDRIYDPKGKSVALSANGGGRGAKTGLYLTKAPNGKTIENKQGLHPFKEVRTELGKQKRSEHRRKTGEDSTLRGKEYKKYVPQESGKSNCITTGLGVEGMVSEDLQIRKLTPIECERLQSLPDNYTQGISNTQRYKCLGNAFNVEVVAHILKIIDKTDSI